MSFDIYQAVTDRIIAELENGTIPWQKPWTGSANGAVSWSSGRPYSLLNQFLLGCGGEWATFKQVTEAGGKVKKGAKSSMVVFWKMLEYDKKDANGQVIRNSEGKAVKDIIPMLRYYNVFNVEKDCEGIELKHKKEDEESFEFDPIEKAEQVIDGYVARSGIKLEYSYQDRAYYSPAQDLVSLPNRDQFPKVEEFYSTAFHELTHSTGHKSRLNRLEKTAHFGSSDYSKEELVAEIGASGILNRLGIESQSSFKNSVAYVQSWLKAIKNDKKLIVSAAGKAEKAIALIFGTEKDGAAE